MRGIFPEDNLSLLRGQSKLSGSAHPGQGEVPVSPGSWVLPLLIKFPLSAVAPLLLQVSTPSSSSPFFAGGREATGLPGCNGQSAWFLSLHDPSLLYPVKTAMCVQQVLGALQKKESKEGRREGGMEGKREGRRKEGRQPARAAWGRKRGNTHGEP